MKPFYLFQSIYFPCSSECSLFPQTGDSVKKTWRKTTHPEQEGEGSSGARSALCRCTASFSCSLGLCPSAPASPAVSRRRARCSLLTPLLTSNSIALHSSTPQLAAPHRFRSPWDTPPYFSKHRCLLLLGSRGWDICTKGTGQTYETLAALPLFSHL